MMSEALPAGAVKTFTIGFGEPSFDESITHDASRSTSAPITTRRSSPRGDARPAPEGGRLPGRAVRRRVDPSDVPALAVHPRVGDRRARRRRQRRAPRRVSHVPGRPLRPALPGAARASRAGRDAARRSDPVSTNNFSFDFKLKRFLRGAGTSGGTATPRGSVRSHRPSRSELLTRRPATRSRTTADASSCRADERSAGTSDLPLCEDVPPGRHPCEGRPSEHGVLARGASAVPRRRARRVPRRVPSRLKLRRLDTKHLLKRAMADLLPPGIADRPKKGFGIPSPSGSRASFVTRCRTSSA